MEALQKFLSYNKELLDFLGVTPSITGHDKDVAISFRTSQYVGTIPLRAPDTGKQIGDFVVVPRYLSQRDRFADYVEILNLLEHRIEPQFVDSIPLASGYNFRPPLYFEAVLYVNEMAAFTKRSWRRFRVVEKIERQPNSGINWKHYTEHVHDPRRRIEFPSRKNILSELHTEYKQLKYVYELAIAEIMTPGTPSRIKATTLNMTSYLNERLGNISSEKATEIPIRLSDPSAVKSIKKAANRILQKDVHQGKAWRVDFSEVFERFVQHIFQKVAHESGGVLFDNIRFRTHGKHLPTWTLSHLEPDAVLQKDDQLFFIEAKYKAHLLNRASESEYLKEEHRHDLHQVMAYSSFDMTEKKHVFLVYPSRIPWLEVMSFHSPINQSETKVCMMGVPLTVSKVEAVKHLILQIISAEVLSTNVNLDRTVNE